MATASVISAMSADGDRAIHPFFTRPKGDDDTRSNTNASDNHFTSHLDQGEGSDYEDRPSKANVRRKKAKSDQPPRKQKSQRTLGEVIGSEPIKASQPIQESPRPSEVDVQDTRRKRRRTSQTESVDVGSEDPRTPPTGTPGNSSPQVVISASSPLPNGSGLPSDGVLAYETPPKKLLKLNANGKFSSPPSKAGKIKSEDSDSLRPKGRDRGRKDANDRLYIHTLVKISYGKDAASRSRIGDKITQILSGEAQVDVKSKRSSSKKRTPKKPKTTHPFFVGKKEPPAQPKRESPRKASAATPGKLRMQTMQDRHDSSTDSAVFVSALLKDRLMIKHPGAKEAPFPSRENAHVRGHDTYGVKQSMSRDTFGRVYHYRKRKQHRLPISEAKSVLGRFASTLAAENDRELRADGFHEPSADLCLPERLLISGEEIAQNVNKELSLRLEDLGQDELTATPSQLAVHPAVRRLYQSIPNVMTAFDESRGEAFSWTQKYAPVRAEEILQPAKQIVVLKQWLQSLAVQSVGGGVTTASAKSSLSKVVDKPKRKRKKKPEDLDDFLVDDDEEIREMTEIVDDDDGKQSRSAASIVESIDGGTKLSNVVILSGPPGCGKSAAAHAVAKEMKYKIFEISSSERRSGRDVLDKVGDMTENHLVKHHGTESADVSSAEEPGRIEEAFQKDLQSGRQGKMSAFFKPKVKVESKPKERKAMAKENTIRSVQEALQRQSKDKDQQQSVILLEEVDILFKDDKEFWPVVQKLITTSKRPVIMTCNDEDVVPLQNIQSHAILRFAPPAVDLATDYMLLIAAAEGHLLPRRAVSALYDRHEHDLRASITELDYWCQMGVGDPREGLGWIYQRWPPGSDVDSQGRRLRLVSDGTYREGMGLGSESDAASYIEETLTKVWAESNLEPSIALGYAPVVEAERETELSLNHMSKLADKLSDADMCLSLAVPETAPLDPTQPELSEKARGNYTEVLRLLQTDQQVHHSTMSKEVVASLTLLAHQTYMPPGWSPPTKKTLMSNARHLKSQSLNDTISRHAFTCFDPISTPAEASLSDPSLKISVFDGPLASIALDLAPYVRSIVRHDQALEEQRERLNLLTSDGRQPKRARTTRAARSALEGGQRATTRRERWFTNDLNFDAVLATGGNDWPRTYESLEAMEGASRVSTDATASAAEEEIKYEE